MRPRHFRHRRLDALLRRLGRPREAEERSPEPVAFGDPPSSVRVPLLDGLPDEELRRLNALLPWAAYTVDVRGRRLAARTMRGMMLDTHVAPPDREQVVFASEGLDARCWAFREGPRDDPFSGTRATARWLVEEDLLRVLGELGFRTVEVADRREERNGPRILVFAEK